MNRLYYKMAEGGVERCLNCGKLHSTENCDYPSFLHSCSACNIISIDGANHDPPCKTNNGRSSFRRNIYSVKPFELFRIRLNNPGDWFYVLDAESGKMVIVRDGLVMNSPGAEVTFASFAQQQPLNGSLYYWQSQSSWLGDSEHV